MKIVKDKLLGHDSPDPLFKYTWGKISSFAISLALGPANTVLDQVKRPICSTMEETNEIS